MFLEVGGVFGRWCFWEGVFLGSGVFGRWCFWEVVFLGGGVFGRWCFWEVVLKLVFEKLFFDESPTS